KQLALMVRAEAQPESVKVSLAVAPQPATFVELREVTQAIASARQSILSTAEERHAKIESLQLERNQDPVTQLANRTYVVSELRSWLDEGRKGWLLVFRLRDLA